MEKLHDKKWVVFVAHPGHELRIHHWLELVQPTLFVLTDGSGHQANNRLASTDQVLKNTGAQKGKIYGGWTDTEAYRVMLDGDSDRAKKFVIQLADFLIDEKIEGACGDAIEHYNPSHDLCRYLLNAAVMLAEKNAQKIANYDFLLIGDPAFCPENMQSKAIKINLDAAALARKLTAAQNYPELAAEVNSALSEFSMLSFATEYLRPVSTQPWLHLPAELPFYEKHGEKQVKQGHYKQIIRFEQHLRPLVEKLYIELGLL